MELEIGQWSDSVRREFHESRKSNWPHSQSWCTWRVRVEIGSKESSIPRVSLSLVSVTLGISLEISVSSILGIEVIAIVQRERSSDIVAWSWKNRWEIPPWKIRVRGRNLSIRNSVPRGSVRYERKGVNLETDRTNEQTTDLTIIRR